MGLRPPKVMKNGFCSATTLNGSAALPFVISTGAPKERSGEICGPAVLSWKGFSTEGSAVEGPAVQQPLPWQHPSSLCHLDRSSEGAQWRDLRFSGPFLEMFFAALPF